MKENSTIKRRNYLRFRRWSRKGFAAFASLGRIVTIGSVCRSIADSSLRKSGYITGNSELSLSVLTAEPDDIIEESFDGVDTLFASSVLLSFIPLFSAVPSACQADAFRSVLL